MRSVRECHPKLAGGRVYLQPFSLTAPVSPLTGYAASYSSVIVRCTSVQGWSLTAGLLQ